MPELSEARRRAPWKTGLGQLRQYPPAPLALAQVVETLPMPAGPTISICTPSFNQAEFLDSTIDSVMSQGYPALDYWVQDGASTDDTQGVLSRWGTKGLRYESVPDDGQADAINRGFARLSGDIMAWLNSDDLLLPGSLASVARVFLENPDVDVVYGHRILIDGAGHDIGRWILPKHEGDVLSWADYIPQETMFWRRELWDAVGGQLDTTFQFALDWDLILRFRDAGAKFHRIPRFLGAFRIHEEQKTSAEMESLGAKEMALLRQRATGRAVSQAEASSQVKSYLARATAYSAMWKVGLVDYGNL